MSSTTSPLPLDSHALPRPQAQPKLYALIIGINTYVSTSEVKSLRGGVPDAAAFREYLHDGLQVPCDQIRYLTEGKATRQAIIEGFEALATDPRIEKGDPIFIFYAGHGARQPAPQGWPTDMQELLIPHDFSTLSNQPVPGITDRKLSRLIGNIENAKGNNITVVLDCCHSASVDRGGALTSHSSEDLNLVRSIGDLKPVYNPEDEDGPSDRATASFQGGFFEASLETHMLIAACDSKEFAKESNSRGHFSTAFLKLLQRKAPEQLRYSDILKNLEPLLGQNPQCRGNHGERTIFNGKILSRQKQTFVVCFDEKNEKLILRAGTANGIGNEDLFTVYPPEYADDIEQSPLGLMTVATANPYTSVMHVASPVALFGFNHGIAVLKQRAIPSLDVCVDSDNLRSWIKELLLQHDLGNITTLDKTFDTWLSIEGDKEKTRCRIRVESTVTGYEFIDKVIKKPDGAKMMLILESAANYFWQLHRIPPKDPTRTDSARKDLAAFITVEFFELEEQADSSLIQCGENLCKDGRIELELAKEDIPYGIKLTTSKSLQVDLFPNVFYFDHGDLSIDFYYMHDAPTPNHKVESPLPKGGAFLPIGYGLGGALPFTYTIPESRRVDLGYLKIFIFTQAVDQRGILQESPFTSWENRARKPYVSKQLEQWDTITIPIIQRKPST